MKKSNYGKYVLGMRYQNDFPYEDMLKCGKGSSVDWGVEKLKKLFDSYEDVSYHTADKNLWESLWEVISYIKKNDIEKARKELKRFHRDIDKELQQLLTSPT